MSDSAVTNKKGNLLKSLCARTCFKSSIPDILAIVQRTGALEATLATAAVQAQIAVDALSILPDTAYRQALMQLAAQLLNRRA